MGVIKPPWISRDWFRQCPFNYCDHFGDKKLLATVCKICHDEILENEQIKKAGKDPYALDVVFERVGESLSQTLTLVRQDAQRLGIDLDNLPEEEEDVFDFRQEPIYKLIFKYGNAVEKSIRDLEVFPVDADEQLIRKAIDALGHSRHYVIAKIGRALSSSNEEQFEPPEFHANDGKTSSFLSYIAILRNCRVMLALVKHKPLIDLREKHLKFAKQSLKISEIIKQQFFPHEDLVYEEFGYTDF